MARGSAEVGSLCVVGGGAPAYMTFWKGGGGRFRGCVVVVKLMQESRKKRKESFLAEGEKKCILRCGLQNLVEELGKPSNVGSTC